MPALHQTALILAVKKGDFGTVSRLLDKGADVNGNPWNQATPLQEAISRRDVPMIQMFLERGGNPDQRGYSGTTAMTHAASMGLTNVVGMLLDHGASLHGLGDWTPLSMAVYSKQKETANFLLQKGLVRRHIGCCVKGGSRSSNQSRPLLGRG